MSIRRPPAIGRPRHRRLGPPLVVLVAAVGAWLAVSHLALDQQRRFLLPPPQDLVSQGLLDGANRGEILAALWATTTVMLLGFTISAAVGFAIAVVMSQSQWLEDALYPYAVVLQTMPTLALVPVIGFWWGFDFPSRVLVCVAIALFPVITNTLFGLKSADSRSHDLFTLHGAGRLTRLGKLQVPAAIPSIFTGLRISAGLSVVGAIVGDFFFRQGQPGIGRLLDIYRAELRTEELLTAVLCAAALGVVMFWSVGWIGNRCTRSWYSSTLWAPDAAPTAGVPTSPSTPPGSKA